MKMNYTMKWIVEFVVVLSYLGVGWTVAQQGHEGHGHEGHACQSGAEHDVPEVHDDHDDHEGHDAPAVDPHAGHDHGDEEEEAGLVLSAEQFKRFGIVMKTAGPAYLGNELRLRGEVVANEDLLAQIPARIPGIVRDVMVNVGDQVVAGDVLARLDSRELADTKADYLAAFAELQLTEAQLKLEEGLHAKQISSEQELLEARQVHASAQIALRLAKQKLFALGCTAADLPSLDGVDAGLTQYDVRSPMNGVIVERDVMKGQTVDGSESLFVVADLSQVWVDLAVYAKDLSAVSKEDAVEIVAQRTGRSGTGSIAGVTPFIDEATRTATARVVLDNTDGTWQPGTFVAGHLKTSGELVAVVVDRDAVQTLEGESVLFIQDGKAFESVPVVLGRKDRSGVEIVDGLHAGDAYVAEGAYRLKSTIITSTLDAHAGHGH